MINIPFVDLSRQYKKYQLQINKKIQEVLNSGNYILGQNLNYFEQNFSHYCGVKYCLGVASGSDALTLSLKAIGVSEGDEVLLPAQSFIATAWTVVNLGAKPVFVDVDNDNNIDINDLNTKVTEKTKAIIPVHLYGKVSRIEEIVSIAKKFNLHVIEDSAQAVGSLKYGKKAGSFGVCSAFSFHPLKVLHAYGDAGAVLTNDENIYGLILKLRNHGLINRDECEVWGINSRLDEIQAAILNFKLNFLEDIILKNIKIANFYIHNLSDIKEIKLPVYDQGNERPNFHRFVIQCEERDGLIKYLFNNGIETKIHYPILIPFQKCCQYLNYKPGDFPNAERLSKRILSLPLFPEMKDEEIEYVVKVIRNFYNYN
ncbi:MAG: DegT/DnrJ/EryC1/StrS family aminotransferase [Chthoniobacterales bacterium]|nr:DegT/DnrJ/EryC1/StrS family aminotransferase [Chthoniobacterales bacterium]